MATEQAKDSELGSEEDFAWLTKGRKGKKGLSKGNDGFQKGGLSPLPSLIKVQARIISRTKAKESTTKEKAKETLILNPDVQPLKHLKKKDIAMPGASDDWSSSKWPHMIVGLQLLDGTARWSTRWKTYILHKQNPFCRFVDYCGCLQSGRGSFLFRHRSFVLLRAHDRHAPSEATKNIVGIVISTHTQEHVILLHLH